MNCQNTGESRWWNGCVAATARQFKEITPQGLRNNRDVYPSVAAAGWHFSFLGGAEKISYKIRSYAHTEYNKEEFFDETHIEDSILKGTDVLKRKGVFFKFMPLSFYPFRLQHFMKMYPGFLHPDKTNALKDIFYFIRRIKKEVFNNAFKNDTYPLVSVAMCTYNGDVYLKDQLETIVKQTYPNLEIVLVDDCSTDNTVQVIQEMQANDSAFIFSKRKKYWL